MLKKAKGFLAVVIMLMVIGLSPCLRRNHLEGWTGVASLTVNQDKNNFVIYFYLQVNVRSYNSAFGGNIRNPIQTPISCVSQSSIGIRAPVLLLMFINHLTVSNKDPDKF